MSILDKFTEEQIAAFEDCKTKEELLEVAAKLGIDPTEEDIAEAMAMIKSANLERGEISDDDLAAVAGCCEGRIDGQAGGGGDFVAFCDFLQMAFAALDGEKPICELIHAFGGNDRVNIASFFFHQPTEILRH